MKKIAIMLDYPALNVPDVDGGAVESLLTILLNENEKAEQFDFYFFQKENEKLNNFSFKCSELIQINKNKSLMFIGRALNKIFRKCKIKFQFLLPYYKKTLDQLKNIKPDVILFEGQYNKKFLLKVKKEIPNVKLLFHIHHQYIEKENINELFDGIITVSDFIKKDYVKYIGKDENKFCVLNNCIDFSLFNKSLDFKEKEELRHKFNINNDDFLVIYCGRVRPEKGVKELAKAIVKCDDNIKLMIVGGSNFANSKHTEYQDEILQIAQKNKDKIIMTNFVKREELYKFYQIADLQVVPSIWEEAAGLVVLEGQVCGVPQIITNSGGMPEYASAKTIVVNKDENLVDNLAKNIEVLSRDEKLRQEIIQAGYENYKNYSKENYYKNFCDIIDLL